MNNKFDDYIKQVNTFDLHKHIKNDDFVNEHLILYGPSGIGKYSQALKYIKEYSPTKCKYEKKMTYLFQNKKEYLYKISDVHFEIDMELLGCNSKVLFNNLFYHIVEIIGSRMSKFGIILCKNFHKIHSELLDIFFTYMQNLIHKKIKIQYVIISEHISFIPDNILSRCQIISLTRPTKTAYMQCIKAHTLKSKKYKVNKDAFKNTLEDVNNIQNINNILYNTNELNQIHKKHINNIIHAMENTTEVSFGDLRDLLYNLLIYNIDIYVFIFYTLDHFINNKKLNSDNIKPVLYEIYHFFAQYNNNYRPIFHLERIYYILYITINNEFY
jgi:hypothetical protein